MILSPCKRCGSKNIKFQIWECSDYPHKEYRCICENHHAYDEWLESKELAVKAWNETPNTDFNLTMHAPGFSTD